jgi:hypothetical protein
MEKTNDLLSKDEVAPESIHWKTKKYQRVALQKRMEKEQEWIKKDENYTTRQMEYVSDFVKRLFNPNEQFDIFSIVNNALMRHGM